MAIRNSSTRNEKPAEELKTLKINWLGDCPVCNSGLAKSVVTEKGTDKILYDGDHVTCDHCGEEGTIDISDNCAYVIWDSEEG